MRKRPAPVPSPPSGWRLDVEWTARARGWVAGLGEGGRLGREVEVFWSARLRTTAGLAYGRLCRIALNPRLQAEEHAGELERTVRHELAHLVAHARAGGRRIEPHGPEWRLACADLGIPGEARCHSLPFVRRKLAPKLVYRCPGCGDLFPRVRRFAKDSACRACCRAHSGGRYDARFKFVEVAGA